MSSLRTQLLIVACVNIGQFIDGYSVGWSAPIIPKLQDLDQSPLSDVVTELQTSWIGSLLYVGAIVGPYIPSYLANIVGRKPCLFFGGLLNLTAIVLIITTKNIEMVYAIRIISGLGMGMVTVSNLVYIGEIASTSIRGILLTSTSIVGISGTLAAYAIGPFVSYQATGYFALVINLVHVVGILFIPESPVYYAIKGMQREAKETLRTLGRVDDLEDIFESVRGIKPTEANSWNAWMKIFTVRANRKSLFITLSLCTLQQTSGVAAVLFFATTIFQLAGSSIRPDIATILIGATRLIASLLAPTAVERAGRRFLLMLSTACCAVSLIILGTFFYMTRIKSSIVAAIGWLPLMALVLYFFFYEIGFGTMPTALVGEMFKGNARSTGSAVSMTTAWLIGFGVATGFGSMIRILGGDVTFWIFSMSCIVAFLFTYKFVPETKGRTLNEIQEILGRPDIATILIGATRLIASLLAPTAVERAGRRFLLMLSTACCAVSLIILGTFFYMTRIKSSIVAAIGWLPLMALVLYFFFYEIGFGTMPTALVGEMFKGNARSTGSAVSMTTAWLIGFGVATGFGSMIRILGGDVTFWIFSMSCIVAFLFTYKFVPETKGRTLNEIQEILGR